MAPGGSAGLLASTGGFGCSPAKRFGVVEEVVAGAADVPVASAEPPWTPLSPAKRLGCVVLADCALVKENVGDGVAAELLVGWAAVEDCGADVPDPNNDVVAGRVDGAEELGKAFSPLNISGPGFEAPLGPLLTLLNKDGPVPPVEAG